MAVPETDKINFPENWERIKEVFSAALELPPESRPRLLANECKGDPDLRREVESWLASYSESVGFFDEPLLSADDVFSDDARVKGRQFGNYSVIKELGRGGMGAVYLVERTDGEFEHRAALKVIRQTIPEDFLVERFKRERQILASLNHPNIARLLDGGLSDKGEPYLVMEFVDGVPIRDHVMARHLNVKETLQLFLKVSGAVSFSHRNLIVHRDIKPANILVTPDGEPKLLDFGLARLGDTGTGDDRTQTAFVALTPAYASPEQLLEQPITTSTDIYSLGVVLYELLSGKRPYELEGKTLDQILQTITEREPIRPSIANGVLNNIDSELDNIVMMALRKEPERRYKTVEQFADDINRYLSGKPISARPNSLSYRARKFVGRHALGTVAGVALLIAIFGGIAASMWQARTAQHERAKAEAVNEFLRNLLDYSDNAAGMAITGNKETTVKEVLNEASKRLATQDLSDQPDVKAELLRIIGASYLTQGQYELADMNLQAALSLQRSLYNEDSPEVQETLVELGQLKLSIGDAAGAGEIYEQRISTLRRQVNNGDVNAGYLLAALNDFALVKRSQGDSAGAEQLLVEARKLSSQVPPEGRLAVAIVDSVYALILSDRGDIEQAESIVRQRIDEIRTWPEPQNLALAANLNALGNFLIEKEDGRSAYPFLVEAEKIYRKLYSENSVPLGDNLRLQAKALYLLKEHSVALDRIDRSLTIYRASTRPQFVNLPNAIITKAQILAGLGKPNEAEPLFREAIAMRAANFPSGYFLLAEEVGALGDFLLSQKRLAEATPLLRNSLAELENSQGPGSPRLGRARQRLIELERRIGSSQN